MHVLRYCRAPVVWLLTLPALAQAPAGPHGSAGAHQRNLKQSPYRNVGHSGWAAMVGALAFTPGHSSWPPCLSSSSF